MLQYHRSHPPHICQRRSSKLDCHGLAGHCHALTQIMPIICQSEDSSAHKRGTSELQGPTEVSQGRTTSHAVASIQRHIPPSIRCQSKANRLPTRTDILPFRPCSMKCHSSVHYQSVANPRQSRVNPYGHFVNT